MNKGLCCGGPGDEALFAREKIFILTDSLVTYVHPTEDSRVYSFACSRKARVERCRASAIASLVTFPRHSSMMDSQARPSATCTSRSETSILGPLNVGLPWHTRGSDIICLPYILALITPLHYLPHCFQPGCGGWLRFPGVRQLHADRAKCRFSSLLRMSAESREEGALRERSGCYGTTG